MGNTKMVYFDGEVIGDLPDPEELQRKTRASYFSFRAYPGEYMNPEGNGHFVIGALESSSMVDPIPHLVGLFQSGTLVRYDSDWTDVQVIDVFDGEAVDTRVYEPASERSAVGGSLRTDDETTMYDWKKLPYTWQFVKEETGFSARIVEFPGCFAEGDTLTEAAQNLERAADAWILATREDGQTVSEPRGHD